MTRTYHTLLIVALTVVGVLLAAIAGVAWVERAVPFAHLFGGLS